MTTPRREFLKQAVAAAPMLAASGCVLPKRPAIAKEKRLRIGVAGVCGRGWSDWTPMFEAGETIAALCDVDSKNLAKGLAQVSKDTPCFTDWRQMLAEIKDLDAVVVSTPDHMHAAIAIAAMKRGCHVFVQKPLVRTLGELRQFEAVAKKAGVVVQMCNQGSAGNGFRRNVEILRSGIIGDVRQIHVWTSRPSWPQGTERPAGEDPVPASLDWDKWLGVAQFRPYKKDAYAPYNWRGHFDFGTGALGDMACHMLNLPFRGLFLGAVEEAECIRIEGRNGDTYPSQSIVRIRFAKRKSMPPVDVFWYDGGLKPQSGIMPQVVATFGNVPKSGCFIMGSRGVLCSTNDYGQEAYIAIVGEGKMRTVQSHPACRYTFDSLPRCKDGHISEFLAACRGQCKTFSGIDHAVPLTEAVLVGCIAQRVPGKLTWDAGRSAFRNPTADAMRSQAVRAGWEF